MPWTIHLQLRFAEQVLQVVDTKCFFVFYTVLNRSPRSRSGKTSRASGRSAEIGGQRINEGPPRPHRQRHSTKAQLSSRKRADESGSLPLWPTDLDLPDTQAVTLPVPAADKSGALLEVRAWVLAHLHCRSPSGSFVSVKTIFCHRAMRTGCPCLSVFD